MVAWESFAHDPSDSSEMRTEKVAAFIVCSGCCVAGAAWTLLYLAVFGWGLIPALPLAFVAIVGAAMMVSHLSRDHRYAVYAEIVCIIGVTTLIQWSIGGISDSGFVVVWSLLGPITALVFFSRRQAVAWFAVYLALLLVTISFNDTFAERGEDVGGSMQLAFAALNIGVMSLVTFAFASYFVSRAVSERARANGLLLNVLPEKIAPILKERSGTIAERFDSATVLFADVVGATPLFAELDPAEAVDWLNEIFTEFDRLTEEHGLEKIKTIGDSYMVAAGVPTPRPDHAPAMAAMALEMLESVRTTPGRHGRRLEFRIGINSGPVVGGVIGTRKFHYDVWGDTVNIASRMEAHGEVGRIHVTAATAGLLGPEFELEERGLIEIKGKGRTETWFVTRREAGSGP